MTVNLIPFLVKFGLHLLDSSKSRADNFARAYRTYGEPQWEILQIMFGRLPNEVAPHPLIDGPAVNDGPVLQQPPTNVDAMPFQGHTQVDNDFWNYVVNYCPDED